MPDQWPGSPAASVRAVCERDGREAVVRRCIDILRGAAVGEEFVAILAGPAAEDVLQGREGGLAGYWPRVWAARGLLHVWDELATSAIIDATCDESWRVREMATKVIARHRVSDGLVAVSRLQADPVARVRAGALRATDRLLGPPD